MSWRLRQVPPEEFSAKGRRGKVGDLDQLQRPPTRVADIPRGRVGRKGWRKWPAVLKAQDNTVFKADELIAGQTIENRPATGQ